MSAAFRHYIRLLIEDVIGEPDQSKEDNRYDDDESEPADEMNVAANVAGAITPLGTSATYPDSPRPSSKKRSPAQAAGSAFGNAKPYYMTKRKKR